MKPPSQPHRQEEKHDTGRNCPMVGGQEIWSICRTLGWHRSHLSHHQGKHARIVCLIHTHITSAHRHAIDGTEPDRLPGAELMGCQTTRWPGASLVVGYQSSIFLLRSCVSLSGTLGRVVAHQSAPSVQPHEMEDREICFGVTP